MSKVRQLSSPWSEVLRVIVPMILGVVALLILVSLASHEYQYAGLLFVLFSLQTAYYLTSVRPLKAVWLDGTDLLIGTAPRQVRVPLQNLRDARIYNVLSPRTIQLRFREPTALGMSALFTPESTTLHALPVEEDLRALAAAATA